MQLIQADTRAVIVQLGPEAEATKATLLRGAAAVTQVTDAAEQEVAVALCRDIKRLLKEVEDSRKAVKAPVLELGKRIDKLAADFSADLEKAVEEKGRLVTSFQILEARRVAAEEKARADAVAKAEAERLAALDEANAKANKIQTEADLDAAIAAEAASKAADEAARAVIVAPLPAVARTEGMASKRVPVVEVVDLHAVYRHDRTLVRLELNKAELNSRLFEGCSVPGLRITWENKTTFRT